MANSDWAKVYLNDDFVGYLEEQPGGRTCFTYDESFIQSSNNPVSVTLPLNITKHYSENGLHPFFDNLVAEGWLAQIQAKALGIRDNDRFKLLMAFGYDLIGAVTVVDPDPQYQIHLDKNDYVKKIAVKSKASMSGVQPKILVTSGENGFVPVNLGETSTYIAKLKGKYPLILENEYLCMKVAEILLKPDEVAETQLAEIEVIGDALLVKRFDRLENKTKVHFEEFASLLHMKAIDKYDLSYKDLADYMNNSELCNKVDVEKLFRRVLACILLGNTDAHLKNFAMLHNAAGLKLSPLYDMVFVRYYEELTPNLALGFNSKLDLPLGDIKAKHLKILCADFKLREAVLEQAVKDFSSKLDQVYDFIEASKKVNPLLRKAFREHIKKRWNGIFKNI
jgi:serine/threonine-protein kinase HipA